MSKILKTLMGGLLLACLCVAVPGTVEAASAKSAASEEQQAVIEKAIEHGSKDGSYHQQPQGISQSTEDGEYLKSAAPESFSGYWKQTGGRWWFQLSVPFEGYNYLRDAYVTISGAQYYFDASGYMVTGWYYDGSDWYYFASSGAQQFGWEKVGGKWYYLDPDYGYMYANEFLKSGSSYYYFGSDGAMYANQWLLDDWGTTDSGRYWESWYYYGADGLEVRGWQKIGGYWYYFEETDDDDWYYTGEMYMNEWIYGAGNACYYVDEDGVMLVNTWLQTPNGNWYFYGADGKEYRGWRTVGSKWYYFDPDDGAMETRWIKLNGYWYYLGYDGAMKTGWINTDEDDDGYAETWYYQGSDGRGYTHWHKIGGVWYHFGHEFGEMYSGSNCELECEGRYANFSSSGAWLGYIY